MKKLIRSIVIVSLVLCMFPVQAFAADARSYEVASALQQNASTESETVYQVAVDKGEARTIYADAKYVLYGITPGYSPVTKATTGNTRDENGNVVGYLRVVMSPATDLSALESDPRITAELEKLAGLATFEEKVKEVNNFVRLAAQYDNEFAANPVNPYHASTTALGCLNGRAICQGFTNLANYLYDAIGVENVKVYSHIKDLGAHIFNAVRDENGNIYAVDSTSNREKNSFVLMPLDVYAAKTNSTFMADVNVMFDLKYPAPVVETTETTVTGAAAIDAVI